MDAKRSENAFREYLNTHGFTYEENYIVGTETNPKNVDFYIERDGKSVYVDVKEIRESSQTKIQIGAYKNIRKDIRKLREKFKDARSFLPIVLVSMNFSNNFFTGFSVARAMLGNVGILYDRGAIEIKKAMHHLSKGNAALTASHNTIISGILIFDLSSCGHHLFNNPYAENPIPDNYFPSVRSLLFDKRGKSKDLVQLSDLMFWPVDAESCRPENF